MRITTYVDMNSSAFSLAIKQRLGPLGIGLLMPNHIVYFQEISILPPPQGAMKIPREGGLEGCNF